MTSREVLTAIVKDKLCPERMGLHESFWQDTQREWEKQGLPPDVNILDYFNLDVREIQGSLFRTTSIPVDEQVVDEDEDTVVKVNGWGAKFREWKNRPGVPEHMSFDLVNEDVWKKKYRESLLELDLRRFADLEKLKENYRAGLTSDRFCVYYQLIIFEIVPKLSAIKKKRIPYVFFSDHSIPKSVHLETYRYALELHKKYGRY
jgi:hypothetical protein